MKAKDDQNINSPRKKVTQKGNKLAVSGSFREPVPRLKGDKNKVIHHVGFRTLIY